MNANLAKHPVATNCRVLEVSTSGCYAWPKRNVSRRSQEDIILSDRIRWIHLRSRGTYGAPWIDVELADEGVRVGRKRVGRPMQAAGSAGREPPQASVDPAGGARPAPDLLDGGRLAVAGPNRPWVANITHTPT